MHKLIVTFLLLVTSFSLSAQFTYDVNDNINRLANSIDMTKFQFGLKISPAITWINAEHNDVQSEGASMKFGIGGVVDYELTSLVSFISGVNYNGFGGYVFDDKSLNDLSTQTNYRINYSQIEVPIGIKLNTRAVKKTSYFIQGGFSAGFIINASEKRVLLDETEKPVYTNITAYTSPTRVSYLLGGGVEYSLGKKSNVFGLVQYNNSITNTANTNIYNSGTPPRYTSPLRLLPGSMEFSIGVMF